MTTSARTYTTPGNTITAATIDRLWNTWVAAWYDGGKDDPKLALLRFDPASAEI